MKQTRKYLLFLISMILTFMLSFTANAATNQTRLNRTDVAITQGKSINLRVIGTSKKVSWSSSKPSIASINKNGLVTGYKKGTSIITATVTGKNYKCKVIVKPLTSDNVKTLTFNELLNLLDKKVVTEDKLVKLIKSDSLSESVIIKLIKKDYITEETALELIKENTLSQATVLQLIKSNTFSKEDIIELIKSNTLTEERVRQIAASYSGLSISEVIVLINKYAPMAGTDWVDGTPLKFVDKHVKVGEEYPVPCYYDDVKTGDHVNVIFSNISIKKYRAYDDPNCKGRYRYDIEMTGNINIDDLKTACEKFGVNYTTASIGTDITYCRNDGLSEVSRDYPFINEEKFPQYYKGSFEYNKTTGDFKFISKQKDMSVNYDMFYLVNFNIYIPVQY